MHKHDCQPAQAQIEGCGYRAVIGIANSSRWQPVILTAAPVHSSPLLTSLSGDPTKRIYPGTPTPSSSTGSGITSRDDEHLSSFSGGLSVESAMSATIAALVTSQLRGIYRAWCLCWHSVATALNDRGPYRGTRGLHHLHNAAIVAVAAAAIVAVSCHI